MKRFLSLLAVMTLTIQLCADEMAEKIRQQNMEVVRSAAESLSETLPKQVDRYTRLLRIEGKGERLVYTFEINAIPKTDAQIVAEGEARHMRENVTAGICSRSGRFIESGIGITYRYVSAASGKELFRFDVDKAACRF